jgi:hypothetical protein
MVFEIPYTIQYSIRIQIAIYLVLSVQYHLQINSLLERIEVFGSHFIYVKKLRNSIIRVLDISLIYTAPI